MLKINLTQEIIDLNHPKLLKKFTPPEGFKVEDYYGVALMTIKRNNHIQIRLQYDFNKKPINGSIYEFKDHNKAFLAFHILQERTKQKVEELDDWEFIEEEPTKPSLFN